MLAKVDSQIADAGSNIDSITMDEDRSLYATMLFVLEVAHRQHLARDAFAADDLPRDLRTICYLRVAPEFSES